jgi:uncharacterized phage protein (TIGR01671 family)
MNRDIKFRVWNKKTNSWVHKPKQEVHLFGENILCGGFMSGVSLKDLHECVALQFTGLKDKKKKEIYEGDILLSESWGVHSRSKSKYHVVEWSGCGWKASGYNGQMKVSPELAVKSDFEIVGNIFESPELLQL